MTAAQRCVLLAHNSGVTFSVASRHPEKTEIVTGRSRLRNFIRLRSYHDARSIRNPTRTGNEAGAAILNRRGAAEVSGSAF
jgi:hypothetical protein